MKNLGIFTLLFLLVYSSLFAQNGTLDQVLQSSAQTIETRLPQGAKVAVLTFTSSSQNFSDYIIDELAIAISTSNKIQVIERQYTDVIRKELNIQMSGDVSDDEVRRVGNQLGAQYVVTGSLIDVGNAYRFRVAAINVESAVREGASSLSININDPQVVFLLTGQRLAPANNVQTYNIGDRGPGGGIIFYATGGVYMECTLDLGSCKWDDAAALVLNHKGGGFSDWRLPTMGELEFMYKNLKKNNLGGFGSDYYWASSNAGGSTGSYNTHADCLDFNSGNKGNGIRVRTYTVRGVRTF